MTQQTEKICFRYDGSDEAIEALKWVNQTFKKQYLGEDHHYYYNYLLSDNTAFDVKDKEEARLVPPAEFLRLMKGETQWTPKYGEEVEVSDDGEVWDAGYYCCPNPHPEKKDEYPHCVIIKENRSGGGGSYKHIRPVRKSLREEIIYLAELYDAGGFGNQDLADRILELVKERREDL